MASITFRNIHGYHHRLPLATSSTDVVLRTRKTGVRFQLVANNWWLYSSADAGSDEDNWVLVPPSASLKFDCAGNSTFTFSAKMQSMAANLHVIEL